MTQDLKPMQHYNAQGELVTSYAKFSYGDRVKAALGHTGTIEAVIGSGKIADRFIVKFDNGTEAALSGRDLTAA